ncbi:B12-binding domain-containing protein [candidate division CSSED10-310 bacterium]|uniref:B12-binding domain-containing protein n=1 Tax=candidate division CSSED10-310 bacterium TaxID=2855610 RepID=A0ABV6Z1B0_UNCC1
MAKFDELKQSLVRGDTPGVSTLVQQFVDQGDEPNLILDDGLLPAMDIVGQKFKNNEFFVPQVLFAARAMNAGMDILKPLLIGSGSLKLKGTVVIGTTRGDQHDIGKNLVVMMLESAGYRVVDLGTDVSTEKFVAAARKEKADILGMSALMTTTMAHMPEVVTQCQQEGLKDKVKIIIGGAPVSSEYAHKIGADGFSQSATEAVDLVRSLLAPKEA